MTFPPGRRIYVYYRIGPGQVDAVVAAVRHAHAALSAGHPRLRAELLRRPDLRDGDVTLMEVYHAGEAGLDDATEQAIDRAVQAAWAEALGENRAATLWAARHQEVFVPCA